MDILSPVHILLLLIIALLVFGPKRLPEIGAGLGKSIREFKAAMEHIDTPPAPDQAYSVTTAIREEKDPPR